jgi:O-succinylbenzoate synthase
VKLKIEPGWDVVPVEEVRARHPEVVLQVDANTAYTLADASHLARLDAFDLLLIEQPLPEDDIRGHAQLARRPATSPGRTATGTATWSSSRCSPRTA